MTVSTPSPPRIEVRQLIPEALFHRLTSRIAREELVSTTEAERIMTQALAFLQACALNPGAGLVPSEKVDIGWHTFVLYTSEYATFCHRIAGRFIHHRPEDEPNPGTSAPAERIGATVAALRAAGLPVDIELWTHRSACSQCYAGCADDPEVG
ncbi:hypothetical protein Sru01_30910 [Sphaerisporangium rufum]|uniref:Uncharacterized protein n=1 Tax=Sphaerisporangium rufum TaxID=1381558 RepID=A0A919R1X2_9ACTN|nr:hypothetical protein [Sphaerisporangium rufum]GII78109.1 hypothetical protein Sru01_30910 [Sphaerisporangium rufum]